MDYEARKNEPDFPPCDVDQWVPLSTEARVMWLHAVRLSYECECVVDQPRDLVLDGRKIDDRPSIYLALGELVNGPGGYFGNGLDSLSDCFCGGFGVKRPTTITWLYSEISKSRINSIIPGYFECVVEELRRGASHFSLK